MSHRFTEAEKEQYERDGYLIRESVFTEAECAEITQLCEELTAKLVADRKDKKRWHVGSYTFEPDWLTDVTIKWEGDSDVVHGLEPFAHISPELEKWAYDPRFTDPMIDLTGDPQPCLFTEKLNLKRPRHGGVNPLHQDHPYWVNNSDDVDRIFTSMLHLDAASRENGCLEVLPGSHTQGQWKLRTDKDIFGNLEMDPALAEGKTLVPVEVPPGSVVMFGAYLVHKSNPNTSDRERRTLLYSYQPGGYNHTTWFSRRDREEYQARKAAAEAAAQPTS